MAHDAAMRRTLLPLAALVLPAACVGPSDEERVIADIEAAIAALERDTPPQTPAEEAAARAAEATLIREAEAFMRAYAEDLRAGNRAALAARYDREGVSLSRDGVETVLEWRDLSYEPAGPDGVSVRGTFLWGPAEGGPPEAYSYDALLVRREGGLRIRIEDEAALPDSPPSVGP